MILDTSFLCDLRSGDRDAVRLARDLDASQKTQRVSAVTVFELFAGVGRSDRGDDSAAVVLDVVETKEVVPVDRVVARKAGRLYDDLADGLGETTVRDCLVAATALAVEEPVVTRTVGRFERFDGLTVREY